MRIKKDNNKSILGFLTGNYSDFETMPKSDVEDFVFLGMPFTLVGIPSNASEELRRNISAGVVAYFQNYSSIDYVAKHILASTERREQEKEDILFEISQTIKKEIIIAIRRFDEIEKKPAIHGIFAAEVCLMRLFISFRSVLIMIRLGMPFEASCLSRLILEQIAWAYCIHELDDGVFNVSPPKSVTNLKKIIPYAGRLYGLLTKDAHISPSETKRYLNFDAVNPQVILSSPDSVRLNALYLLRLADAFLITSEIIYRHSHTNFQYIEKTPLAEFVPKEETEFRKFIKRMEKGLFDQK